MRAVIRWLVLLCAGLAVVASSERAVGEETDAAKIVERVKSAFAVFDKSMAQVDLSNAPADQLRKLRTDAEGVLQQVATSLPMLEAAISRAADQVTNSVPPGSGLTLGDELNRRDALTKQLRLKMELGLLETALKSVEFVRLNTQQHLDRISLLLPPDPPPVAVQQPPSPPPAVAIDAVPSPRVPPATPSAGSAPSPHWVAMGGEGQVRVGDTATGFATGTGHAAPVVSATLLGGGTRLVTPALDGSVRLTDVEASARLTAAGAPRLTGALYDRLWKPYGAPVAQEALWLAAQVLPLRVPETLEGQRGRVFRDCAACPEMVEIGAGSFLMGSPLIDAERSSDEGPRHWVRVKPFAVGRFAVTFDEWDACVDGGGCKTKPSDEGWGRGNRPVINVSWDEVTNEYIPWLNKKTGQSYRLLSEAEREYVTRAGTTTAFWWGPSVSTDQANYNGNTTISGSKKGEYRAKTEPVDSFKPNPWGLYQVHGNVWEWTADCWHDSYRGAPDDGSAWTDVCTENSRRVVRGGTWGSVPGDLRSAMRLRGTTDDRSYSLGFRVGRLLPFPRTL